MKNEMLNLTKEMVNIPSVNGTLGEKDIGVFIEKYLRDIDYFKDHPELVVVQELEGDVLNRRNVFALLIGEKERKADTLIFHGHTDTVGIEDYADLKPYACNPDELMKKLKMIQLPKEIEQDLNSEDYLFGRGACDMKSGDAVFLVLMKHLADNVKELSGNILVSFNPVEENLHTGIIEGCTILNQLKEKYHLEYKLAINNDFICPMYPGDPYKYIYTGVGGKLLPCFYIQGKETHVGQCFEGFDASLVAANLVKEINLNSKFSDGYKGEYSLPPAVLKMKDLKTWYNVQTAQSSFVYFNYFVHNAGMDGIVKKLIDAGKEALEVTKKEIQFRYKEFCKLTNKKYSEINMEYDVMTYEQLFELSVQKVGEQQLRTRLKEMTNDLEKQGVDKREIPITLIREMLAILNMYKPTIVLYFAPPYCPHNTLQQENEDVLIKLENIISEMEQEELVQYRINHFFPSLSDSSYLRIDDSEDSVELLKNNFPQMEQLYPIPLEKIQNLNIPAVNFGVYGKDAHKWTERVNISYSFGILPKLIMKTIKEFLV